MKNPPFGTHVHHFRSRSLLVCACQRLPCAGNGKDACLSGKNEHMCYGRFMQDHNPMAPRMPLKKRSGGGNLVKFSKITK